MDRKLYSRLLGEFKNSGINEIGLFYINEPFTCDWLPQAIAEARLIGIDYIFLTTNGSIATPRKVRACMEAGLNSLKFSVNFFNLSQFVKIANVSEHLYPTVFKNLKLAREVRDTGNYDCGLYASSIAFDGDQGEKMKVIVDEFIRPFVDEFYFLPLYSMGGASDNAGMKPSQGNPGRLDNMVPPLPCWSCFTEGHIMVDGKLSACCFGKGIDSDGLIMADLNDVDFMTGWNSIKFQELRKAHLAKNVDKTACGSCVR
jgi:hypothetical protein